jgi:hypothetical protein
MEVPVVVKAKPTRAVIRERADNARKWLARLTLWFPVAGSVIILANAAVRVWIDGEALDAVGLSSAFVQLWGLYGPYLVAITAYLWAQARVPTTSEKAPNGWQMSVLAHSFTIQLIVLVYSVPLVVYAVSSDWETANKIMGVYQSAVHTFTAAAITYFFARPEQEAK